MALDLYRSETGRTRQVMRGLRRREFLPVRDFDYYIDRLTVVQNGFGDQIVVGQGRDVRGVPHPLGSGATVRYDYRIVDSLRLQVPTLPSPVRVYEVEVRPKEADLPGFVGSVFLEADAGGLVRMDFTFTPASYVDPRTDRVTVRLEHALWEEAFWLPYRQTVEVRRETPELDLPVGSVIRAKLEVTGYDFEPELEDDFFRGASVVRLPYGAADSAVFSGGLADRMAEEGLSPIGLAEVEAEARASARALAASGLPRLRLYADGASSVVRVNAAEGVRMGIGASYWSSADVRLEAMGGYGTWSRKGSGTVRGRWDFGGGRAASGRLAEGRVSATVEAFGRQLRDAGHRPVAAGVVNTVAALARQWDYSDPYFASGARATVARRWSDGGTAWVAGFGERHAGAAESWFEREWPDRREHPAAGDGDLDGRRTPPPRPLRRADDGVLAGIEAGWSRKWGGSGAWGVQLAANGTAGRWEGSGTATLAARLVGHVAAGDYSRRASAWLEAGRSWGAVPRQRLFFVGGRGTLPGHRFREYGGRALLLAQAEASASLVTGWLAVRALAGAGATGNAAEAAGRKGSVAATGGLLGYAGVGLATLHEIVRVDGAWGLPRGRFELVVSVAPWLRPYL